MQKCQAVADAIPDSRYCVREGQDHGASPEALAPALEEFFAGETRIGMASALTTVGT